jgi:acetyl-CoA/propionyl-CoA carboxylase, biotin carboxylase, biotin carboxyl carrier protein
MPGTVVAVNVADGDHVDEGQVIVSVEAMKMEHALRAPFAGVVSDLVSPARRSRSGRGAGRHRPDPDTHAEPGAEGD